MSESVKRGDAVTFLLKHKPYIDLGVAPSANDYRDACCVTFAIYDTTQDERLIESNQMTRVPNRPGWYYYRYQTTRSMKSGIYTVTFTTVTTIDGIDYTNREVKELIVTEDLG